MNDNVIESYMNDNTIEIYKIETENDQILRSDDPYKLFLIPELLEENINKLQEYRKGIIIAAKSKFYENYYEIFVCNGNRASFIGQCTISNLDDEIDIPYYGQKSEAEEIMTYSGATKEERINWTQIQADENYRVFEYHEGLARVQRNNHWGYVDVNGNEIVPCSEFDYAEDFHFGFARVTKNGKNGVINKKGDIVINCNFSNIKLLRSIRNMPKMNFEKLGINFDLLEREKKLISLLTESNIPVVYDISTGSIIYVKNFEKQLKIFSNGKPSYLDIDEIDQFKKTLSRFLNL